ncbi:MAG: hypothetical protein M1818_003161 [Claussenomyces sp. TS43310]|nr:MAG: hypothetical protein M1818_003161 [Claussenomyces sp. TS43310]
MSSNRLADVARASRLSTVTGGVDVAPEVGKGVAGARSRAALESSIASKSSRVERTSSSAPSSLRSVQGDKTCEMRPIGSSHTKNESITPTASSGSTYADLVDTVTRLRQSSETTIGQIKTPAKGEVTMDSKLSLRKKSYSIHDEVFVPSEFEDSQTYTPPSLVDHPGSPSFTMTTIQEICFLALICSAQLLCQAGLTMTIAPLSLITPTFPAPNSPSWYTAAYSLTLGTFILPSGRLGDVFGHKRLFLLGWIWLSFWSVLAGFSPLIQRSSAAAKAEVFFIVCRALQGIGPALLMPNAMAFLGRKYAPGPKKNMIFALFGACAPTGAVAGAAINSLVAERASWEWEFWIMGICAASLALATLLIVPAESLASPPLKISLRARWAQLDGTGACLGVVGLILLNVSLNQAPLVGWHTPYTYCLLLVALIFLVLFCLWQTQARNTAPLIPAAARTRTTVSVLACVACGWASFGIYIFYTWTFIVTERHLSPLRSCLWLLPAPIGGLLASVITGVGLHKLGAPTVMLAALCAFFVGLTVMATVGTDPNPAASYWTGIFFGVAIMPFGMDMSFPSATILLSDTLSHAQQGVGASLVNTVVNYSISLGLGIAGTAVREAVGGDRGDGAVGPGVQGYKDAMYAGMGLSGVGVVVAATFLASIYLEGWRSRPNGAAKRETGHA